ncbi:MAG TPA: DNA polymerase III subunit alpha, partial [Afifellaceae bacterium]|nr:DNA polymerase III subunit alpha [Afifellaceae bacterium]
MGGNVRFIHLNCHSAFSLLEGALPIPELIERAAADGMPAIGICDTANLFGALEFSEKAAEAGIQPIIGCKLPVVFDGGGEESLNGSIPSRSGNGDEAPTWMQFLCADETGYGNLVHLVTNYYLNENGRGAPIAMDRLARHSGGLIALTGGHDGVLYPCIADGDTDRVSSRLEVLGRLFSDRLYVSVERHGMPIEEHGEAGILSAAYAARLPIVATNEPCFPLAADYEAHDALLAVAEGRVVSVDDRRRLTPDHHFASQEFMAKRFCDLPEALEASVEIARRCHFRPTTIAPILPRFTKGEGDSAAAVAEEAVELRRQAQAGLAERLAVHGCAPGLAESDYRARLDFELDVIERMQYPGYFLIVADFIKWAKGQDIPVGPGRGSGAGSVVAWSLTITDLDPLRFALLFERFLNPDRVSMPDFDIDFCQERRDEVIGYVQQRYGAQQVAQIITFGTLQARAALRDVGRVLEMP